MRFDTVYNRPKLGMPYVEQNATQFMNVWSNGCWTLPSTASIFSGLLPHEHMATTQNRKLSKQVVTLAQKLQDLGYQTNQITANVATTNIFNLDRGFHNTYKIWEEVEPAYKKLSHLLLLAGKPRIRKLLFSKDLIGQALSKDLQAAYVWFSSMMDRSFEKADKLIKQNQQSGKRTFLFINLMETHFPYHVSNHFELQERNPFLKLKELYGLFHFVNQTFLTQDREVLNKDTLQLLKKRQIKSWDLIKGRVDKFIAHHHQGKKNLVIFASDHGDNFGEENWAYHFSNVTNEGTKVPLFWLDHLNASNVPSLQPMGMRMLYYKILCACGYKGYDKYCSNTQDAYTLPISESFWYNNRGKTLPKYRYNQFSFIKGSHQYILRGKKWYRKKCQLSSIEHPLDAISERELPEEINYSPVNEAFSNDSDRRLLSSKVSAYLQYCAKYAS